METTIGNATGRWASMLHRNQVYGEQIWAIGGGKGGVGKSLVSSSLAYTLAKQGIPTLAIDLDLGGANLHTVLGLPPPAKSLSDLLSGKVSHIRDCVTDTEFDRLKIIAGAKDDLNITQINRGRIRQIMEQIRALQHQFIILDLGAGTSEYTLDFFNMANVSIITGLPEPTSIENAYRFLKAAYYQRLLENPRFDPIRPLIEAAMSTHNGYGIQSPTDLLNEVSHRDSVLAHELRAFIKEYKPKIIMNQTRSQPDVDVGFSMKSVAKKYFGIDMDYLGYLEYEPNVWQSVRRMRPILAEYPHSRIALHVERMCNYLLKQARMESPR